MQRQSPLVHFKNHGTGKKNCNSQTKGADFDETVYLKHILKMLKMILKMIMIND